MAGPAAIRIGAVRRRSLEIAGLKVFSSLQGPAGERRTIHRKTCVAVIAIDIGNNIGSKPNGSPGVPHAARSTAAWILDVVGIAISLAATQ